MENLNQTRNSSFKIENDLKLVNKETINLQKLSQPGTSSRINEDDGDLAKNVDNSDEQPTTTTMTEEDEADEIRRRRLQLFQSTSSAQE